MNDFEFDASGFETILGESDDLSNDNHTEESADVTVADESLLGDATEKNDTSNDNSSEVIEGDYMSNFLSNYGIQNGIITYENEDGTTEDVKFADLDDEEKVNILKNITTPNLTQNEIETLNYLRSQNATLQDVVEYYSQKAVQDYIEQNGPIERSYAVDDYTDDELFLVDLKTKFADMSDDELKSELETAKENEDMFKKKVDIIRKNYKDLEEQQEKDRVAQQEEMYRAYDNALIEKIDAFQGIAMDYKDEKTDQLAIENHERLGIYEYIMKRDENGYSQLSKDLNDPDKLINIAWYALYGKDAFSDMTRYWKSQLKKDRREDKPKSQVQTTVKKTDDNKKDTLERHRFSASFVGGENLL